MKNRYAECMLQDVALLKNKPQSLVCIYYELYCYGLTIFCIFNKEKDHDEVAE